MKRLFGAELAASIEREMQRIREVQQERDERISRGETDYDDCFISIRSDAQALDRCRMELDILKGDGCVDFDAIIDENGDEVSVHWFENKWRKTTCVARGVFASSIKALLKKTGWTQKTIRVPVWVKFCAGSGGGMCSVYTGSYQQVRWHTNMVTGEYVGYPD